MHPTLTQRPAVTRARTLHAQSAVLRPAAGPQAQRGRQVLIRPITDHDDRAPTGLSGLCEPHPGAPQRPQIEQHDERHGACASDLLRSPRSLCRSRPQEDDGFHGAGKRGRVEGLPRIDDDHALPLPREATHDREDQREPPAPRQPRDLAQRADRPPPQPRVRSGHSHREIPRTNGRKLPELGAKSFERERLFRGGRRSRSRESVKLEVVGEGGHGGKIRYGRPPRKAKKWLFKRASPSLPSPAALPPPAPHPPLPAQHPDTRPARA